MKQIPEVARERLSYNPETGDFVWIYKNKMHPKLKGNAAGTIRKSSKGVPRLIIKVDGVALFAHRIAWYLYHLEQPNIVDHINGNTLDNRICNLRNVTCFENAKNHGRKFNKSGLPCGVRMLPSGRYESRIRCNKKAISIGTFDSVDEAEKAYLDMRNKLFKDYSIKADQK